MLKKLQEKWKVGIGRLILIIITFALGGSVCGRLSSFLVKKVIGESVNIMYILLWIILATLLWPICVIIISIPLGQFAFFKNYVRKVFERVRWRKKEK